MATGYKIKTYQNLSSFTLSSEHFWKRKESLNSLFWEITSRSFEKYQDLACGNVFKNGLLCSSFIRLHSNYLMLSTGHKNALGSINSYIKRKEWVLKGVLGPDENTEYFSQIWHEESDFLHEINKKFFYVFETSGVLNDLSRDRILSCSLVKAKESDWPRIRVWAGKFASESVARNTEYETVKLARQMLENGTMFMLKRNSESIAMAGFGRKTQKSLVINMVYVPEEQRGNGFATKLVIEMNKIGKSLGFKRCVLFSDQNLEENLYKRMGCKLVGKFSEISFEEL